MFKKFAVLFILSLACNAFANNKESSCLKIEEQKELGALLLHKQKAIAKDPNCLNMWGAGACLSPRDDMMKEYLEERLIECSVE